jgi:hypothetical protein
MRACYLRLVRTTISLPDALFERAKKVARTEGVTLSQLVEGALRDRLLTAAPAEKIRPFRLVTFGSGGTRPGVSFEGLKQFVDDEDAGRVTTGAGRAADGDDVDP